MPFLAHTEQLQRVTRSIVASIVKRIAPQWQLPW
jgi:hypothetical protein